MQTIHRRRLLAALLASPVAALAQNAPRLGKLTLAGWNKPITEVMPLLVDADKAFYRADGVALEFAPGAGSADATRNTLRRPADVAFTDPPSFSAALEKGEQLRAIYAIYPQNVFSVVSLKASNLTGPAVLKGRKT